VWHSTEYKYRKVIYRCNHKYGNEKRQTPHVTEDEIKEMFVKAYNELVFEKKKILGNLYLIRTTFFDTPDIIAERDRLQEEMTVLVEMTHSCAAENARIAQNQDEYQERYDSLVEH